MPRPKISEPTIKALFAKSGNVCAFPGCNHELVTDENVVVSQICHIEAANPLGERYNSQSNDEYRSSYPNLILLCYKHHKITNDIEKYPVSRLKQIKADHEKRHSAIAVEITDSVVDEFLADDRVYWKEIEHLVTKEHVAPDLAFNLPMNENLVADFDDLLQSINEIKKFVADLNISARDKSSYINDFLNLTNHALLSEEDKLRVLSTIKSWDFELTCLAIPNSLNQLELKTLRTQMYVLSVLLKINPADAELISKREEVRENLRDTMLNTGLLD